MNETIQKHSKTIKHTENTITNTTKTKTLYKTHTL
jgi:hypothetical protein